MTCPTCNDTQTVSTGVPDGMEGDFQMGTSTPCPDCIGDKPMRSVLQDWVQELPFMQQSVLITSCRGPDGLSKDHVAKGMCKFIRRTFMISAFDGLSRWNPHEEGGGSFTGPASGLHAVGVVFNLNWPSDSESLINLIRDKYLDSTDDMPHHFQTHIMHTAQVLGYKHPDPFVRRWWHETYLMIVNDLHLLPESKASMNKRLGDNREDWESASGV